MATDLEERVVDVRTPTRAAATAPPASCGARAPFFLAAVARRCVVALRPTAAAAPAAAARTRVVEASEKEAASEGGKLSGASPVLRRLAEAAGPVATGWLRKVKDISQQNVPSSGGEWKPRKFTA